MQIQPSFRLVKKKITAKSKSNEVLTEDNIILNSPITDRWEAIKACGQLLVDNGYVKPEYIDDMIERERSSSIYMGNNVAIPHGLDDSDLKIIKSGIVFLQTPKGVQFDDEPAYMCIGIAGKGKGSAHVEILGQIAEVCSDMDNVEILKTTKDKKTVLKLLAQK